MIFFRLAIILTLVPFIINGFIPKVPLRNPYKKDIYYSILNSLACDDLSIIVLETDGINNVVMKIQYDSSDGIRRSWVVSKSYNDFVNFDEKLSQTNTIPLFPKPLFQNPDIIQNYLENILGIESLHYSPFLAFDFLDVPKDLLDSTLTPKSYYDAEVVQNTEDDHANLSTAAKSAVAGAILGGIVAGPVGAIAAGAGAAIASKRKDTAGEVARTMARAVDVASKNVKKLDNEYHVLDKATTAAGKAVNAAEKVLGVTTNKINSVNKRFKISEKLDSAINSGLQKVKKVLDKLDDD